VREILTDSVAKERTTSRSSKMMSITPKAGDLGNPANFTTAIYFPCGGLDRYPR
jgi:hypothetical protein